MTHYSICIYSFLKVWRILDVSVCVDSGMSNEGRLFVKDIRKIYEMVGDDAASALKTITALNDVCKTTLFMMYTTVKDWTHSALINKVKELKATGRYHLWLQDIRELDRHYLLDISETFHVKLLDTGDKMIYLLETYLVASSMFYISPSMKNSDIMPYVNRTLTGPYLLFRDQCEDLVKRYTLDDSTPEVHLYSIKKKILGELTGDTKFFIKAKESMFLRVYSQTHLDIYKSDLEGFLREYQLQARLMYTHHQYFLWYKMIALMSHGNIYIKHHILRTQQLSMVSTEVKTMAHIKQLSHEFSRNKMNSQRIAPLCHLLRNQHVIHRRHIIRHEKSHRQRIENFMRINLIGRARSLSPVRYLVEDPVGYYTD